MNLGYNLTEQREPSSDHLPCTMGRELDLLVVDERNKQRAKKEMDYCSGILSDFFGYPVRYTYASTFDEAEGLIRRNTADFYRTISWVREKNFGDAVDFAFFQREKSRTLMMKTGEIDPGSEFFLRRYIRLLPAKNLYEASLLVLEEMFD